MKPGRWWRAQNSCVDNAKLILLSDKAHRNWFNLNCVANEHGGVLPSVSIVAVKLRVSEARAAAAIAELVTKKLFDQREDGSFVPHDWNQWQYKTDESDPTNAERQQRYRERHRNANSNGKSNGVTPVTAKRPDTETDTEDKIVEASARAFTEGSKALASAFWKALGFNSRLQIPPEYAGIDWRALSWEQAGWTTDLIDAEIRRIGPDKPIAYYEKVFTTAFAKRRAPLPVVEIREAETVKVTAHGKPKSAIIQAADDLCRTIAGFDGPKRGNNELCGPAREAPARLLSNG